MFDEFRKAFHYFNLLDIPKKFNIYTNKNEMLQRVLTEKTFPDLVDEYKMTLLHLACSNKIISLPIIKFFIDNKIDANMADNGGNIALHFASKNKNASFEIIKYLGIFFIFNFQEISKICF